MTRTLRAMDLVVIASLIISSSSAFRLADRAEQKLGARSTYQGGWPLAASSCPADASVACFTGGGINPTCCPNGQTCFGSTAPYCCPSETDCASEVNNLPVCANSTWDMYGQDDNAKFFCCQSGQLAVDPNSGYTGICEGSGQVVPVSLRATMVSQIGGTSVPPFRSYVTGASESGASASSTHSPATTTPATKTGTATASATKSLLSSTATGSSLDGGTTVTTALRLSLGAIIGIVVGGCLVVLALLSLAIWCCCCRGRRRQPFTRSLGTQEPYNSAAYLPPQQAYTAPTTPQQMYSAPHTPQQGYGVPPTSQQMYSPMPPTYQNSPYDHNASRGLSPGAEYKSVSPHMAAEERPNTSGRSEML